MSYRSLLQPEDSLIWILPKSATQPPATARTLLFSSQVSLKGHFLIKSNKRRKFLKITFALLKKAVERPCLSELPFKLKISPPPESVKCYKIKHSMLKHHQLGSVHFKPHQLANWRIPDQSQWCFLRHWTEQEHETIQLFFFSMVTQLKLTLRCR